MRSLSYTLALLLLLQLPAKAQLLWQISGNSLEKPSYLMGTYHLANPEFATQIPGFFTALEAVEQVVGEISTQALTDNPQTLARVQQAMLLPQGQTLDDLLSPEQLTQLNLFLKQLLGADLTSPLLAPMKAMKPAAIEAQLQIFLCMQIDQNFSPEQQIDTYIQQLALQNQKSLAALETLDSQIATLFDKTTTQRQAELLMCLVENADYASSVISRTIQAYYNQDLDEIDRISNEKFLNACDATPEEEDILVYSRNQNWAQSIPQTISQTPSLIAVGAAHLPGEKGLIQLLQNQGFTLTPVN